MLSVPQTCASVRTCLLSTLLFVWCPVVAQINKPSASPRFEVADIHPSQEVRNPMMGGGVISGGRFVIERATMLDLIAYAYGAQQDHIVGGPSWLDWNRFDIYAKMSAGASSRDTKAMVQSLLAERFHLKTHSDTRPIPTYILRIDESGWKFKPADPSEASTVQQSIIPSSVPNVSGDVVLKFRNEPIHSIVYAIGDWGDRYVTGSIADQTSLHDKYDFEVRWKVIPTAGGTSLFDALQKQLGLKLTLETAPGSGAGRG